jgi:hypothetical protein
VEPRRFQLEGPSIEALKAQVLAEHGPRARIIAAEKVTVGGIGGFLARHHYEVTVQLPPRGRRRAPGEPDAHKDAGIAALLDRAEQAEARLQNPSGEASSAVSTASPAFAELMDTLTFSTETADVPAEPVALIPVPEPVRLRPAPAPLSGAGDLVIVVGLGEDALEVCRSMSRAVGAGPSGVRAAGLVTPDDVVRAGDRRAVAAARAAGVMGGYGIFLAYSLGRGATELGRHATLVAALSADQLWVVADAGRKHDDTAAWIGAVRAAANVEALAVEGLEATATPQTVNALGLPIGWLDGGPAPAPVLS